jgi:hypothetical protein
MFLIINAIKVIGKQIDQIKMMLMLSSDLKRVFLFRAQQEQPATTQIIMAVKQTASIYQGE